MNGAAGRLADQPAQACSGMDQRHHGIASAQRDLGGAETVAVAVRAGDHSGLLEWLQRNVHQRASLVPVREVIHDATGMPAEGPVDTNAFVAHLRNRYL